MESNGQDYPVNHQALDEAMEQRGGGVQSRGRFQFLLEPLMDQRSERMGVRERVYRTRVRQVGAFDTQQNLQQALIQGLQSTIEELLEENSIADRDRIYFHLVSSRLQTAYDGWGLTAGEWRQSEGRVAAILENLSLMLNSNEQFEMDDSFQLSFVHVCHPHCGDGKRKRYTPGYQSCKQLKKKKRSVVKIDQTDENLCCARAIVTAKAIVDCDKKVESFKKNCTIQHDEAIRLHLDAHVPQGQCGHDELQQFVKAPSLLNYKVVVVDANRCYQRYVYGQGSKMLTLFYEDGHYDVITSLKGFFDFNYFCPRCFNPYNNEGQHACKQNKDHCGACRQTGCPDFLSARLERRSATLTCSSCLVQFFGQTCLDSHKTKNIKGGPAAPGSTSDAVCNVRRKCCSCYKVLRSKKEIEIHKCGYATCPSCRKCQDLRTHKCFIQTGRQEQQRRERQRQERKARPQSAATVVPIHPDLDDSSDKKDEKKLPLHVFFDIECMQEDGRHVPNLVIADTEDSSPPHQFEGDTCIRNFIEWLDLINNNQTQPLTVIAHNFQGYDSYPIIEEYHHQKRQLEQIRNGGKILQLTVGNICFIDSLSFFQMPLSAFPETFGLAELRKGYFPHFFNTRANQAYVGPIPPIEFYGPESMSVKGREEFLKWYASEVAREVKFDLQCELLSYCKSDVKLLKEGCLTFKKDFEAQSGFNPFNKMTIASACNWDLRKNRLENNTIASEPLHGWRLKTNHSNVSMEWLMWIEHHDNVQLQHARNEGEFRIPNTHYTVDGYDHQKRTVYEFHGCYWHGCRDCYPQRREKHRRLLDRTMDDVYSSTTAKIQQIEAAGYTVKQIWECQWNHLKRKDPKVQDYVASLNLQTPLEPRDAFFGGRTNAIQLYHHVEKEEEIRYYDYTSLYPFVNKNSRYPIGHPEIIYNPNTTDISQYFGLAKCTVLPPTQLYHAVLPYRTQDKLTFPLCRACVEEQIHLNLHDKSDECQHTHTQRALTGTWCTPELEKAVDKGYTILQIHEAWHFQGRREGLFRDYVNTWLKIKEEASGWPADCDTQEKRAQHIKDYQQHEDILLEQEQVAYNPGKRALAKLMLNSMWGKFGQRINKTQVKEFTEAQDFQTFLDNDQNDIRYVSPLTEDRVEVHYRTKKHSEPLAPNINIFVACFTTCWARLRLYEALDLLKERVLYFDTDSVIFVHRKGDVSPRVGKYLGDFKDELGGGDYIVEFCSGGPKNYGYKTHQGKTICKVRGFSLNCEGSTQLNYDVLRENVLQEIHHPLAEQRFKCVTQSNTIVRNTKEYSLHTQQAHKNYRLVFNKRVLKPGTAQSYPYGYRAAVVGTL